MGYKVRMILEKHDIPYIVVDHNPDVIEQLRSQQIPNVYGSIDDDEILEKVHLDSARMIISTVPSRSGTVRMLRYMKSQNIKTTVIVLAFHADDAHHFYEQGADYVIHPTLISADHIEELLNGVLEQKREHHIAELKEIIALQQPHYRK